jgi:biotin carboxyl carrier protein
MPGKIVSVTCAVGDVVSAGQGLVVAEAMKMETAMTASAAGRVVEVLASVGEKVGAGDLLVRLEPVDSPLIEGGADQ